MEGPISLFPIFEIENNELILKLIDSSVENLIFLMVISYSRDIKKIRVFVTTNVIYTVLKNCMVGSY